MKMSLTTTKNKNPQQEYGEQQPTNSKILLSLIFWFLTMNWSSKSHKKDSITVTPKNIQLLA